MLRRGWRERMCASEAVVGEGTAPRGTREIDAWTQKWAGSGYGDKFLARNDVRFDPQRWVLAGPKDAVRQQGHASGGNIWMPPDCWSISANLMHKYSKQKQWGDKQVAWWVWVAEGIVGYFVVDSREWWGLAKWIDSVDNQLTKKFEGNLRVPASDRGLPMVSKPRFCDKAVSCIGHEVYAPHLSSWKGIQPGPGWVALAKSSSGSNGNFTAQPAQIGDSFLHETVVSPVGLGSLVWRLMNPRAEFWPTKPN